MTTTPKRRWYQFSLKAMLVVMTLVCFAGGFVAYEQQKARAQKAVVEAIEKLGGTVVYDQEVSVRSATMRQILGDETYGNLVTITFADTQVTDGIAFFDADLVPIAGLNRLTHLDLDNTQVTDAGLVHLARLTKLKVLSLTNTRVEDVGLVQLSGLNQVEDLWLDGTQVTDAGLVHLTGFTKLEYLSLENTQVTDAGLEHLASLKRLIHLNVSDTQVTDVGVAELQKALPNCQIDYKTPL